MRRAKNYLSPLENRTLAAVRDFCARHPYGPTLTELATETRATKPGVQRAVNTLLRRGFLGHVPGRASTLHPKEIQ